MYENINKIDATSREQDEKSRKCYKMLTKKNLVSVFWQDRREQTETN